MFAAGAGKFGNYECCAWQSLGVGQYRALSGSSPHHAEKDALQRIPEHKVEMICPDDCIKDVIKALVTAHPYEFPVFEVTRAEMDEFSEYARELLK